MRVLVVLLLAGAASAALLPHYDLDSLIWKSYDVVEAEYEPGRAGLRVVRCFAGDLKPGTELALPAPRYIVEKNGTYKLIAGKTRVFLFLAGPEKAVLSGRWLVYGGRVLRPIQSMNPGSYVWPLDARAPDADAFRKALPERIRTTRALRDRLTGRPKPGDAPGLVRVIRDRKPDGSRTDLVARAACRHLAILRDYDALVAGLQTPAGWQARYTLGCGFANPAGRDFLLARIAAPNAPAAARERCAAILGVAGPMYHRSLVPDGERWRSTGSAKEGNGGYLTRVAKAALALREQPGLCRVVTEQLAALVNLNAAALGPDKKSMVPVLVELYGTSGSGPVRYEAARVLRRLGPEACARITAPAVLAVLAEGSRKKEGHLDVRYSCEGMKPFQKTVVVFEGRGAAIEVPIRTGISPGWSGGTGWLVPIPRGLKPGRYRVFLRVYLKGGKKSDSYGFETELS